jgi:cell surface protein SprA
MKDREGDFVTDKPKDPFYLKDPPAIEQNVEYDTKTGMYIVTEKVAGQDVRPPMYMTYEDYLKYTEKQERAAYIKDRQRAISLVEDKSIVPPIQVKKQFFDKLFGGSKIEIKPQGNVEMTLGGNTTKTNNPNIPIRNRKTGGFDFDMNININVIGKIGDKLQLGVKYNTQSGFDFDNQVKLGYTGDEDDIIKVIEAGNVSLPLQTRLITGSQTLFGVKTQLQFGRLTWTSVISQQKSKKETMLIENGAQRQNFEIRSDQYEENKHFFLAQYFRNQYDYALSGLPNIKSVVNITRIEVWVTNRNGTTQNVRDVVGLNDLGEAAPYSNQIANTSNGDSRPRNEANNIYGNLLSNPNHRFVNNIVADLQNDFHLEQGQDFEKTYARKLNDNEYTFNRQLGYVSLNSQLNPNEVLAVAFQYEYNGAVFQVGEFGNQVPPDSNSTSKVLYLKLLKGTTVRPMLPIWNLMMKNIYALGAFNLSNEDFRLDIYYNDPGGGLKRYMPKGCLEGKPLIRVLNLDHLNMNNDPQPDGLFDYVPGVTIITQNGRLIFPVKEPFGDNLRTAFNNCGDPGIANQYVYDMLYDSTKFRAQQFPEFNRFVIKGQYKGSNNREISLGAGNIPRGSVVVSAGGQKLTEGTQYSVDYNLGRVTILDQGILNSGQQVKVDYENNNLFAAQVRSMYGTRLDYRISSKFNIGATVMHLQERPYTQKVNIGDDPISNTIMGLDVKYETNAPWLTKALDKLPIYSTKEMSTISTYAEMAYLKPGHSKAINGPDKTGQVYVDDFEGTSSGYDLKTPPVSWKLASTPRKSLNSAGHVLFPEADYINDDRYNYNRAKISWYRIDNSFFNAQTSPDVVYNNHDPINGIKNHYVRLIPTQEVFPNRPNQTIDQNLYTFDLTYYPKERGPYNFESSNSPTQGVSKGIGNDGSLNSPETRWGGIMRSIDNNDLEASNVEFIEFWMLDPFLYRPTSPGGKLYFDLGNISEDILRDSRMSYENGVFADTSILDATPWGFVPKQPSLVDAFDNDQTLRPQQDVGFDGMPDEYERVRKFGFLDAVSHNVNQSAYDKLRNDPASDDYTYFKDETAYGGESKILARYKDFTGVEGNSEVQTNSIQSTAQTNLPDKEDLNKDNTLNENEEYFQYEVDLRPGMAVGNNPYIVAVVDETNNSNISSHQVGTDDGGVTSRWLQFRIPIREYTSRTGNIPDFKSIQFMRMFLTGWQDTSVTLRFGTLELRRNQWRTYNLNLNDPCEGIGSDAPNGYFNVSSVGIEEHSGKLPVNYVLPPNIERTQALGAQTNQFVAQNEQSLAIKACDLKDCGRKAVFKNLTLDVRRYKRLKMFIHANSIPDEIPVHDKEVTAFIRIGSDFKDNYYEYEVPLRITPSRVAGNLYDPNSSTDREIVWPDSNSLDIVLQDFVALKQKRNTIAGLPRTTPYTEFDSKGRLITIVGNPDIGAIKTIMLGLHNPHKGDLTNPLNATDADDGQPKCIEVWFDELRVADFEEFGGVAALATVNVKLADLGNVSLSGSMHTKGFGQVEQKIDQRYKDNLYQYDFATNIEVGKLLPEKAGIRIPFYGAYGQQFSTPEFDPYQFDIPTRDYIKTLKSAVGKDSARHYLSQIQTINTRRGYNFSNVRIVPQTKAKRPHVYDPGNFNFTYSYNEVLLTDPYTEKNSKKNWMGIIGWSFAPQTKDLAPFKKIIKSKSKWLDIIKDFSWNPMPSTMSVTTDMNRDLTEIKLRSLGEVDFDIPATYSKNFRWNRAYVFKYNPFKSLSIDYSATDNARIDEPLGLLNTKEKKNEVWGNIGQGGRNTNYNQQLGVNYTVPINKLPALDWVTATVGYNGTYTWTALPWQADSATGKLIQNSLGNIISNSQNDRAKIDFNFKKLYDKVPFLKTYNAPNPNAGDKKENDKKREAVRKAREKIKDEMTKLKEKRVKMKEDLAKAKDIAKNDTSYHSKKIANQQRIKAAIAANAVAINEKKKEVSSADKKDKPAKKDEVNRLKDARKKLKEDLRKAHGDAEVQKLKSDLKANKMALKQKKTDYENKQAPSNPYISIFLRPLLSLKKVTFEYKQNKSTTVPGFVGYSQLLGNQYGDGKYVTNSSLRSAPGYDFSFGAQLGDRFFKGVDKYSRDGWLDEAASKGWITRDTLLNQKFTQLRSDRLDATATLEPWPDFKIDLTLFRDYTQNHSQFFKYVADDNGVFSFAHLNPVDMGSYSISYLPARTMFDPVDKKGFSNTYSTFEKNREIISQRLGLQNNSINQDSVYRNPSTGELNQQYKAGYGPKSQDVLIPAFLAAYNKQDANKVSLNPFKAFPMPNWRISYNGLSKFKWIQKVFTNFTITHGYNSTLTVSSFQTNLSYRGDGSPFGQSAKDTLNGNFFPLYNMPSIVLNEQLSPLLGVDMTFKNGVTAKVDYKQSRTQTMNFSDFQLIELKSKQLTIGAGYKIKGLKLPIKIKGKKIRLDNDLNFRFDFSYRDNITINHRIDEGLPQITAGSRVITIQPSIDYIVSKRLNVRLFFDQTMTVPKISSGFPTTNTKGGITLRFSLAD